MSQHNEIFIGSEDLARWHNTDLVVPEMDIFYLAVKVSGFGQAEELPLITLSKQRLEHYVNTSDTGTNDSISLTYRIDNTWEASFLFSVRSNGDDKEIMFKTTSPGIYNVWMIGTVDDNSSTFTIGTDPDWVGTRLAMPDEDRFDLTAGYTSDGTTHDPQTVTLEKRRLEDSERLEDGDRYRGRQRVIRVDYEGSEVHNGELCFTLNDDDEIMFWTLIQGRWTLELV